MLHLCKLEIGGETFLKSWKIIPHFSLLSAREPLKDRFVSKYLLVVSLEG